LGRAFNESIIALWVEEPKGRVRLVTTRQTSPEQSLVIVRQDTASGWLAAPSTVSPLTFEKHALLLIN
jgi:hypothetical protein